MTVIPDLFYGDAIEMNAFAGIDLGKWVQGGYSSKAIKHDPETIDPIIAASLQKMRNDFGRTVRRRNPRHFRLFIRLDRPRTDA